MAEGRKKPSELKAELGSLKQSIFPYSLFDQGTEFKLRHFDLGEGANFCLFDQGLGFEGGHNIIPYASAWFFNECRTLF